MTTELSIYDRCDRSFIISEFELNSLFSSRKSEGFQALDNAAVLGIGLDNVSYEETFEERQDLLFIGGFLSPNSPNEDALLYFLKEVFPLVVDKIDCRINIAGLTPPESILALQSDRVRVLGYVENSRELYAKSRIFVAPHRFASGIAWKVAGSMANDHPWSHPS